MKLFKTAVALLLLSSFSAIAADLPSIKSAPVAATAPMWAGFHVGLNAGGMWNNNNPINIQAFPLSNLITYQPIYWSPLNNTLGSGSKSGFIGGGQIGYDWQVSTGNQAFIVGLETDFQGIASSGINSSKYIAFPGLLDGMGEPHQQQLILDDTFMNQINVSANLNWLGTVRGRVG